MKKFNYWMWAYKNPHKAEWLERTVVLLIGLAAIYWISDATY